jgi:hypothetical protein
LINVKRRECPNDWVSDKNGTCYHFVNVPKSNSDALKQCNGYQAELVSVKNEANYAFLKSLIYNLSKTYTISNIWVLYFNF